jgi:hypothetical protein
MVAETRAIRKRVKMLRVVRSGMAGLLMLMRHGGMRAVVRAWDSFASDTAEEADREEPSLRG